MNEPVTFEQAKRLKELGFDELVDYYFDNQESKMNGYHDYNARDLTAHGHNVCSRPTISHALDWCREMNGVMCCINPYYSEVYGHGIISGFIATLIHLESGYICEGQPLKNYYEVQSAALDAALDYIKEQQHPQGGGE